MDFEHVDTTHGEAGFTLVELIVTLAVGAIIASIAIPSFRTLVADGRVTSTVNKVIVHFHLARSEAVRRGAQIVLCPGDRDGGCRNSSEWQHGFILFTDTNRNRDLDRTETVIKYAPPLETQIRILTTAGRRKLFYQPNGMSLGSTATVTVCEPTGAAAPKAIILSNAGRIRTSDTRPGGDPLSCY